MTKTTKGILYLIASAFFFALMAALVRLAGDIFFMQKAFFRNAVSMIIALVLLIKEGREKGWDAVRIPEGALLYLFIRAMAGSVGIFGNFYAIDRLVLSDASILNKMSPFFAIVFSYFLIKEKIRPIPLIAIIVAFLGSLLIIKPSFNFTQMLPSIAGFAGGVGAGLAYACVRKLGILKCNGKVIVLFFSVFSTLLTVPYMIFNYDPMTLSQTLLLCGAGVSAAGGQFTITAAYYHAPAREISIYDYSQIIFSTSLGFVFFGMIPDVWSIAGYVVIVSMALLNYFYTIRQHRA